MAVWSQCTSSLLPQVNLFQAFLNYYLLNTLYPDANSKNGSRPSQVWSRHHFWGRNFALDWKSGSPESWVTLRSHLTEL